jgi:hypothetical protein
MEKHRVLTRVLAIVGTVLVWLPLLAPLLFGLIHFARAGRLLVDFLMPAELFPVVLAGSLLLIAASVLARSYRRLIIGGFAAAIVMLVGAQALAEVTGLASGAIEPQGIWWLLTLTGIGLYIVALVAVGVGGILLLRRLFGGSQPLRPVLA